MSDIQHTLVLLKPDAVQRQVAGEIIARFERVGLKIVAMKMVWADAAFSKKHYADHISKPFYKGLEETITAGPVIAMVLEGVEAIALVRKMVGATEPKSSAPGTIRGDFAHVSYSHADSTGAGIKNLIHASDSPESAKKEIDLWFDAKEAHSYKTANETHVR